MNPNFQSQSRKEITNHKYTLAICLQSVLDTRSPWGQVGNHDNHIISDLSFSFSLPWLPNFLEKNDPIFLKS